MIFRTKIENSCMRYNDEWILYSKRQPTDKDFTSCKIVVTRPVFDIEIQDGLVPCEKRISVFDEKVPQITKFLDDVFEIKHFVNHFKRVRETDPNWDFIGYMIDHYASAYYDCMAGGVSGTLISLIREVCKVGNIDLTTPLYPGKIKDYKPKNGDDYGGWYTLGDLFNDQQWPDLTLFLHKIQNQIPSVGQFLLE